MNFCSDVRCVSSRALSLQASIPVRGLPRTITLQVAPQGNHRSDAHVCVLVVSGNLVITSLPTLPVRCRGDGRASVQCVVQFTARRQHPLVLRNSLCASEWTYARSGRRAHCQVSARGTRFRVVPYACGLLVCAIGAHSGSSSGFEHLLQV